MAELSRDFLINFQTRGGKEASKEFDSLTRSVDGTSSAVDELNRKEKSLAATIKTSIANRVRGSTTYQAINAGINGQLDTMIEKADSAKKSLSGLDNFRFTSISSGIKYAVDQLKSMNEAGNQVNRQLETMAIRLTSSIKESKKLTSIGQASKLSQEYIKMARDYAAKTPFEQTEVLSAMSALSPVFKADKKKIKNAMEAAAILAQIDPNQGFEGATFAIREAASGDTRSLAARFELSPSQLKRFMAGNSDIGLAIQGALKENGATKEMLEMYSSSMEGMQSNISDSRNYIAGMMNEPIYNARKERLYSRMEQQQRLSTPGGGLERGMGALGQAASLGMNTGNLVYQSLARPFNSMRMGVLDSLSPGLTNAKAAMREAELKLQIDDLSRRNDLSSVEKAKLKDLRRQLRDLPVETRKLIREAQNRLEDTGQYIAKVLGLDPKQTEALLDRMRGFAKKFNTMVEDVKKSFTAGDIRRFIDNTLSVLGRTFNAFTAAPKRFLQEMERTGMLKFLKDTFDEINIAVRDVFRELFGATGKMGDGALNIIDQGKSIADLMVSALNRSRPFIAFMKNVIVDLMKAIQLGILLTGEMAAKVMGIMATGLRLVGKGDEAEKLDKDRMAIEARVKENRQNALDSYETGDTGNGTPTKPEEKKGWSGFVAPILEKARENPEVVSAAKSIQSTIAVTMASLAGIGIYQNVKGIFNTARAGQEGLRGTWAGARALGAGGLKMFEVPGAPGIRQSFGAKQLLSGRGLGANVAALGLNAAMPGPVSQMYGAWVWFRNLLDAIALIRKWMKSSKNMSAKGWETIRGARFIKPIADFLDRMRAIPATIGKTLTDFKKAVGDWKPPKIDLAKGFKSMADTIKQFNPLTKSLDLIRSGAGKVGSVMSNALKSLTRIFTQMRGMFVSFGSSAAKVFASIGSRLQSSIAMLLKVPVIGPMLKAAGVVLGSTAASVVSAGATGWQVGRYLGGKDLAVKGQTLDESVQLGMMMQAAERKGGYMGISQQAGKDYLQALDDKQKRQWQDEDNARADSKSSIRRTSNSIQARNANEKSIGTRHSGGYIGKTGQYTLQSGEYVLPAGGFNFQKYTKNDNMGGSDSRRRDDSVRGVTELMTNSAVIAATARYSEAVMRLMGLSPSTGSGDIAGGFGVPSSGGGVSVPVPMGGSATGGNADRKAKFNEVLEAARAAGDPHPEVTAAQWALESGWGKSSSGKNNFFGIKAKAGEAGTYRMTKEQDKNGNVSVVNAKFRDYDTAAQGVQARVDLMKSGRYGAYGTAQGTDAAIAALKAGGYATDVDYEAKLKGILASVGYDPSAAAARTPGAPATASGSGVNIKMGDIVISAKDKATALKDFETAQAQQAKEFRDSLGVATRKN